MFQHKHIRRLRFRLWRAMSYAMPNKYMNYKLPGNLIFHYPLRSSISGNIIAGGYELNEAMFIRKFLQPGDTFVDIGANGGYFTLIAARRVGETGRVIAFEPDVNAVEILKHNIKLNQLENVQVINSAISDKDGEAEFAVASDGAMSSLAKNHHPLQQIAAWHKVKTLRLDTAVEKFSITNIRLIKIDVEGAETLVLGGGANTLSSPTAPTVMCEFSDRTAQGFKSSGRELWNQFYKYGYQMFNISVNKGCLDLAPAIPAENYGYENIVACKEAGD